MNITTSVAPYDLAVPAPNNQSSFLVVNINDSSTINYVTASNHHNQCSTYCHALKWLTRYSLMGSSTDKNSFSNSDYIVSSNSDYIVSSTSDRIPNFLFTNLPAPLSLRWHCGAGRYNDQTLTVKQCSRIRFTGAATTKTILMKLVKKLINTK